MSISAHHIIRQQYLDVELNGTEADGLALQRSLPGLYEHWLTPVIEGVLNRFAPPEGHLCIERLEIDAGTMSLKHLERDLASAVAKELEKWLCDHNPPDVRHKTVQHSIEEAFIYFLETGSLPWSFHLPAGGTLEKAVFDSLRQIEKSDGYRVFKDTVLQALFAVPARMRLVRQFTPAFLEILLSLFSPAAAKVMGEVLTELHGSAVPSADLKSFERNLWETAFADLAAGNILTARGLVIESWIAFSFPKVTNAALKGALERYWPGVTAPGKGLVPDRQVEIAKSGSPGDKEPETSNLSGTKKTPISVKQNADEGKSLSLPTIKNYGRGNVTENQMPGDKLPAVVKLYEINKADSSDVTKPILSNFREAPLPGRQRVEEGFATDAAQGIYIENAGLVILHPFLPQLFTAAGISANAELLKPQRALCLLHFLATGRTTAPEYELALPKILCNIPLTTPVESDVALTDSEQKEAYALLEAVIRHWEVLRNTSPDSLRGTFLLRHGKVSLRDDGDWLLQVEAQSFDILLDQLPWGISLVKLPWMERMLWVEWH